MHVCVRAGGQIRDVHDRHLRGAVVDAVDQRDVEYVQDSLRRYVARAAVEPVAAIQRPHRHGNEVQGADEGEVCDLFVICDYVLLLC